MLSITAKRDKLEMKKKMKAFFSYFRCALILETFQLRMNLAPVLLTFIALDSKFAAKILVSVTMSEKSFNFSSERAIKKQIRLIFKHMTYLFLNNQRYSEIAESRKKGFLTLLPKSQ